MAKTLGRRCFLRNSAIFALSLKGPLGQPSAPFPKNKNIPKRGSREC
jgi:hypothetical protein